MQYVFIAVLLAGCFLQAAFGQGKRVAITIDDVPFNGMAGGHKLSLYEELKTNHSFLKAIEKVNTPVAVFFTGRFCLENDSTAERLAMLQRWIEHPLVTLGNHTRNHLNHSKTNYDTFVEEVSTNDYLLRSFAGMKPLTYFRFPYNALGKDSADRSAKEEYLSTRGYLITPFTIESADYVFNALYENELRKGNTSRADSIEQSYVDFTIASLRQAEVTTQEIFGRSIDHIFLCHDNPLNSHCYAVLIEKFKALGYGFITLEEALKDPIYRTPNYYHGTAGISWVYRWIPDAAKRKQYLRKSIDPDMNLYHEYEDLENSAK